jgi:hypothetical protein
MNEAGHPGPRTGPRPRVPAAVLPSADGGDPSGASGPTAGGRGVAPYRREVEIGKLLPARPQGAQLAVAAFVARRNDPDHGHDLPVRLTNPDPVRFACVVPVPGATDQPSAGRNGDHRQARGGLGGLIVPWRQPQGQDVRDRTSDRLLGKGKVIRRQPAGVQRVAQSDYPALMKSVKTSLRQRASSRESA